MEINVVDTSDKDLRPVVRQLIGMNHDFIQVPNGNFGVEHMVYLIINRAMKPQSIDVLRIYSHGNSGIFAVTGGTELPPGSFVDIENISKLEPTLRRLTPYFKPGARVELQCCFVATKGDGDGGHSVPPRAGESEGENLIIELARIWGVKVFASGNVARGSATSSIAFQGTVVRARSDGVLTCEAVPDIRRIR